MSDQIVEDVRALDLSIDENDLLGEWQGQGALMLDYGVHLADAIEEEDQARAALGIVVAQLDRDIRSDPAGFGLTKATETTVINAIPEQPAHKAATALIIAAKHKVRILRAAVDAVGHRKSSLQGMTDVFLRQWYADPHSTAQPEALRAATPHRPSKEAAMDMTGPPTKTIKGRRKRR